MKSDRSRVRIFQAWRVEKIISNCCTRYVSRVWHLCVLRFGEVFVMIVFHENRLNCFWGKVCLGHVLFSTASKQKFCNDKRHWWWHGPSDLAKGNYLHVGAAFQCAKDPCMGCFWQHVNIIQKSKPNVDSIWFDLMEVFLLHRLFAKKKEQHGHTPKQRRTFQQMVPGKGAQIFPFCWGIKMKI